MIAEIANALLCLATFAALAQWGLGGYGILRNLHVPDLTRRLTLVQFALITVSFGLLMTLYIISDFSVMNVYENSHSTIPLLYKITGSWGNHEGSMLLWLWVLSAYGVAYAYVRPSVDFDKPVAFYCTVLTIVAFVAFGLLLFILLTSNPFLRIADVPIEGRELNPLLQDIGLAMHPPLLYLGYVGFVMVFAIAIAALVVQQDINSLWAVHVRPWALLAWSLLTAGIGLGSWGAYRELGWGGWWFWDPVENVSLLPWLSATALIHCLLVLTKRPILQNWTLLLAIFTFTFSLLGTFLVRSGLLTSVHSFASDPTRGLYILSFIALLTLGSLAIYAVRYPRANAPDFVPLSREGGIMVNNLLLVVLCATILLGIIYPLLMQIFTMPSVSVGAPYYNTVVVPICVPLLILAGLTPLISWRQASWKASLRLVKHSVMVTLLVAVGAWLLQGNILSNLYHTPMALFIGIAGVWMLGATLSYGKKLLRSVNRPALSQYGMLLAHGGLAVFAIAAACATVGRVEAEHKMIVNDKIVVEGYEIELAELEPMQYENYMRTRATLHVTSLNNQTAITLTPEMRYYPTRQMETSESSIFVSMQHDLYTAVATGTNLGNSSKKQDFIVLRVYIIPAMWWLWLGFLSVAMGGLIAAAAYFHKSHRFSYQGSG